MNTMKLSIKNQSIEEDNSEAEDTPTKVKGKNGKIGDLKNDLKNDIKGKVDIKKRSTMIAG